MLAAGLYPEMPTEVKAPMIKLVNVQKIEGTQARLEIDFLHVAAREVAALVGPPASGKSLVLQLLTGELQAGSGIVQVAGLNPVKQREALVERIGVLFQENALYERQSARDNLVFHCRLRGLPHTRADEILELIALADQSRTPVSRLSPASRRRLAFGRLQLHNPQVLLLDHPFAGCDLAAIAVITRLIERDAGEGASVLILSQDTLHLRDLCNRIYFIDGGKITERTDMDEGRRLGLPFRVPARQEGQVILVNPGEILFVSTAEGQTILHTQQGEIASQFTLSELAERLAPNGFFRAHRSYLVNLQRVKAIIPYTRDSYTLILNDPVETEIPLSKTAARELRELLDF